MKSIVLSDKKDCCGCNACGDVCPKGAITFVVDGEGFLYPHVDSAKCIDCGLCAKICPQCHAKEAGKREFETPKCFAAVHKNLATRFDSTSGGAFSALANVIYRQGGFVGGAVWNEDFSISQYISDKKGDLPRLRSSKYAQSDARGFYRAVKAAVETKRPVLVCGTPCQTAAVRLYLGRDYENLYVVDFICRGNNSPLVFRKYLDWQEERNGGKVVYVKPKNKELGWRNLTTKLVFDNGKIVYDTKDTSYFTKGYLQTNAYCRPSCYACHFKGLPLASDITVADFWGANSLKLPEELDRNLGTSLIIVGNSKGMELLRKAEPSLLMQELTWEQAKAGNVMMDKSLPPPTCNRDEFFRILTAEGFGAVAAKYIGGRPRVNFLSRIRSMLRHVKHLVRRYLLHPAAFVRLVRVNGLLRALTRDALIRVGKDCHLEIEGELRLGGDLDFGRSYYKKPVASTHLAIRKNGRMTTAGPFIICAGADVEVFSGGHLDIGSGGGSNVGLTVVCADHIKLGNSVMMGRHVTIRDNNGGHWMNLPGYKNSKPVEIGDHVWLCEGCTIMPGVKIGTGAVVGAKAVVFNNVPANTLVTGNPAEVVCEQVEWKY